ncbi:MAG: archease [Candidatus Omnitrophica bacterium]|nr:archease [Candidatus Omnitrophota bacterium]
MFGASREELFENAAAGLFSLMTDLRRVKPRKALHLELKSSSVEGLFVEWLSELLYRAEVGESLFSKFNVRWKGSIGLVAEVGGEGLDQKAHVLKKEVKAVTRHGLRVEEKKGKWVAEVIFDV